MDQRLVRRAVSAVHSARDNFSGPKEQGDSLVDTSNALGELIESVDALVQLVVGGEAYEEAVSRYKTASSDTE